MNGIVMLSFIQDLILSCIILATFSIDFCVISIFSESVMSHECKDSRYPAILSYSLPAASSLSLNAFSLHVKVNFCSMKSVVCKRSKIWLYISSLRKIHENSTNVYSEQLRKLSSRKAILSSAILLVSSVTIHGLAIQHQSPSSQTLLSSSCCSSLQVVVLPIPGAPLIMMSFFLIESFLQA